MSESISLLSNPGAICCFSFIKNSFSKILLRLTILLPWVWDVALDEEKVRFSSLSLNSVTPLNPRIHPLNVFLFLDVYKIISSSILISPYLSGKLYVPNSPDSISVPARISVALKEIFSESFVCSWEPRRVSNFTYSSIFCIISEGEVGYSWEI